VLGRWALGSSGWSSRVCLLPPLQLFCGHETRSSSELICPNKAKADRHFLRLATRNSERPRPTQHQVASAWVQCPVGSVGSGLSGQAVGSVPNTALPHLAPRTSYWFGLIIQGQRRCWCWCWSAGAGAGLWPVKWMFVNECYKMGQRHSNPKDGICGLRCNSSQ
jgi:hypothetical protein